MKNLQKTSITKVKNPLGDIKRVVKKMNKIQVCDISK